MADSNRQDPTTFRTMVRGFRPEIADLAQAARKYVLDALPGAYEIVWPHQKTAGYGTGPRKMTEHFAWIAPFEKHVVLGFYYGGELPDPKGLLEGTGARMRHVKLRAVTDLEKPGLDALLAAALKHRVPPLRHDADADLASARKAALAGPEKAAAAKKPEAKAPRKGRG